MVVAVLVLEFEIYVRSEKPRVGCGNEWGAEHITIAALVKLELVFELAI